MPTLNLGILAHVDAGKTSLTERLLFDAGVIDRMGSVDNGDTQTDTNAIERRRGITIRAAVAAFTVGDLQVNLVDTPGHPDFIAEVERALGVLDGAVLVVSAVEGVQAQTRLLMRALRNLGLPTVIFANKIDRRGARVEDLIAEIERKLSLSVYPVNAVENGGTAAATSRPFPLDESMAELLDRQASGGSDVPAVFGSALTGTGVETLLAMLAKMRPAPADVSALDGTVFAIERDLSGRRRAYVRLFGGEVRTRQLVQLRRRTPEGVTSHRERVTSLEVIGRRESHATSGAIARIGGLTDVRVGDWIGAGRRSGSTEHFARPGLEALVTARHEIQTTDLRNALGELAQRDPLINTRALHGGATSVLLYGDVQKEVLAATLREEFGVDAVFHRSDVVHLERPVGTGEASDRMSWVGFAAVGLRVAPGRPGTGVVYRCGIEPGWLRRAFHNAIEETTRRTLDQGLNGWPVTDCVVTLIDGAYDAATSTGTDFRVLTPLVLMDALAQARTRVFEPCHWFELDVPDGTVGQVVTRLAAFEADVRDTRPIGSSWLIEGEMPARLVQEFRQLLPGLSRGEGVWTSHLRGDRALKGVSPSRARTDGNPCDRQAYLLYLRQGGPR